MAKHKKKDEVLEPQEPIEVETEVVEDVAAEDKALKFAEALKEKDEQFLRMAAEYDNYRKRSQKEKEGIWQEATAQVAVQMLPIYDSLARALQQGTEDADFLKGVAMTMGQLEKAFEKLGVSKVASLGELFDPERHNAVLHIEDEAAGENTIVEVFEEGFMLGEKVIRFAMVKVAN
jgi:Molecular chaperone GrpE (heat shock protein)